MFKRNLYYNTLFITCVVLYVTLAKLPHDWSISASEAYHLFDYLVIFLYSCFSGLPWGEDSSQRECNLPGMLYVLKRSMYSKQILILVIIMTDA